jgi:argininosuccinate synthase
MPSCVLAYSGGLDTSVILGWLQDEGYAVHAVYVDLGQPCEDRDAILKKARDCGAASARIVDAREELCRDFAFPVLGWQAKYEGIYLLGTSIARPLISKVCLQVAREVGATAYAHGATGKGNDQCRFQLAAEALEPEIQIIAPWRMKKYRDTFPGRTEMIAYCDAKQIPVKASISKPYSSDENCLHISYEAGKLEDPAVDGISIVDFGMTVSPQAAPDKVEEVRVGFEHGVPVSINGQKKSALAMAALYAAHMAIEQLTVDRDTLHLRDRLAPEVAEMVYYGFWFVPKMDALMAFSQSVEEPVTGEVTLGLYKGNVFVRGRTSPNSLYDAAVASMEGGGSYDQTDAEGFLRIQGLPSRVLGKVRPRKY